MCSNNCAEVVAPTRTPDRSCSYQSTQEPFTTRYPGDQGPGDQGDGGGSVATAAPTAMPSGDGDAGSNGGAVVGGLAAAAVVFIVVGAGWFLRKKGLLGGGGGNLPSSSYDGTGVEMSAIKTDADDDEALIGV